jgi:hypothetical protein
VAGKIEKINAHRFLAATPEGKRPLADVGVSDEM